MAGVGINHCDVVDVRFTRCTVLWFLRFRHAWQSNWNLEIEYKKYKIKNCHLYLIPPGWWSLFFFWCTQCWISLSFFTFSPIRLDDNRDPGKLRDTSCQMFLYFNLLRIRDLDIYVLYICIVFRIVKKFARCIYFQRRDI